MPLQAKSPLGAAFVLARPVRDTLRFVDGGNLMSGMTTGKSMPGKPQSGGMKEKMEGKGGEDHKAAVSKMHPEHVHKLVTDAHAGKYGPQAQQVAQMATQPQQGAMPPQDADDTGAGPSSMFSSSGASPAAAAPSQPASRASMFQGR